MTIELNNVTDLQAMKDDLAADYILGNDIDASVTSGWNEGAGFEPIGTEASPFTGSFDGQDYAISDLCINRPEENYVGLFGVVNGATSVLKDLNFANCLVVGNSRVGMLVGRVNLMAELSGIHTDEDCSVSGNDIYGGLLGQFISLITISFCSTAGVVNIKAGGAGTSAGGIVGYFPSGNFDNCYSSADVTGGIKVGGFAGDCCSGDSVIENCYATGAVEGTKYVGGFVGVPQATCKRCYATGNVTLPNIVGNEYAGGFVGFSNSGLIENCYAKGDVQAYRYVGGFFGRLNNVGYVIKRCYSIGQLSGTLDIGGFGASNIGTVENCFWDTETSGIDTSEGGTGKITTEMYQEATYTNWDFVTPIWYSRENISYPILQLLLNGICSITGNAKGGINLLLKLTSFIAESSNIFSNLDSQPGCIGLIIGTSDIDGSLTVTPALRSNSAAKKWYDMLIRKGIDATVRIYPDMEFFPDSNETILRHSVDYPVKIIPPYKNREGYKPAELITSGRGFSGIVNYNLRFDVEAGLKLIIDSKGWTVIGFTEVKDNTGILVYLLEIESGN